MFKKTFFICCMVSVVNGLSLQAQDSIHGEKIITSIFSEAEIQKSYFYISLWGDRYRNAYATPITVPVSSLKVYQDGLKVIKQLGGSNTRSLLLSDANDTKYVMRALRKNTTAYLTNETLKEEYELGELDDTYTAEFIDDLSTGAHPYISLVVGALARDLDVIHTSPLLVYIPRDGSLGNFASTYGDELYYIEKQIPSEILTNVNTPSRDTVVTTSHVLKQLRTDASFKIDETAYIKARIFDMLIGDWNRAPRQWDWLAKTNNGETMYIPISKNSDHAFSKMGDGGLMKISALFSKKSKHLKNYDGALVNPKWLNKSAFALDKALITNLDYQFWDAATKAMVHALTDEVIIKAFATMPEELDQRISEEIITHLKQRRAKLPEIVDSYVKLLSKLVIIRGTDKNDHFIFERMPNGSTQIIGQSKDGMSTPFYSNTIQKTNTGHVWLYGLDGDDLFEVKGSGNKLVPIAIFGGGNTDSYNIKNNSNIRLYDFPSQAATLSPNDLKVHAIDEPEAGRYNYKRTKRYSNKVTPLIGVNVDDGLRVGAQNTFTDYGFQHTPFTQQHTVGASFYFATSGFDLQYTGAWIHVFNKLDLGLDLQVTSPNYTLNFFGFGNETINLNREDPETFKLNYNRVRMQKLRIAPSIGYRDPYGYSLKTTLGYTSIHIEQTSNRFIEEFYNTTDSVTENSFAELAVTANYNDEVQDLIPFLDVDATVTAGNTFNITESSNAIFVHPELTLGLPFDNEERVKVTSRLAAYINFNTNIEFYQGASLGAETGLRAYRNQRFTGVNSFVQSSDIAVKLNRIQTRLIPVDLAVYGGFDSGRVWIHNDTSNEWKTAIGGGVLFDTSGVLVGDISAFHGDEGLRVSLRLGVGF